MRNRLSNLHAVDLMIVEEIPEVEIVAVDFGGKMVNADPAVVVEVVMEIVAVDPVGRMANVEAAENAGPVVGVDAPVIVEVAGGAKAVAEVAADEAVVAEAKPSSLIV